MKSESTNIFMILLNNLSRSTLDETILKYEDQARRELLAFFEYNNHNDAQLKSKAIQQNEEEKARKEIRLVKLDSQRKISIFYDEGTKKLYYGVNTKLGTALIYDDVIYTISGTEIRCIRTTDKGLFIENINPSSGSINVAYYDRVAVIEFINKNLNCNSFLENDDAIKKLGIIPDLEVYAKSTKQFGVDGDPTTYTISLYRNGEIIEQEKVEPKNDPENRNCKTRTLYSSYYEFMKKQGYFLNDFALAKGPNK